MPNEVINHWKPSDFMNVHPWNSIMRNSESESMACSLLWTMYEAGDEMGAADL